jgi:hypothetical protein
MRRLFALPLLLAASCSEKVEDRAPPLDSFYYPVGVALAPSTTAAGGQALLVSSSDVDLRYGPTLGSTLISIDTVASFGPTTAPPPLEVLGALRVDSYAGPVTVANGVTCPGYAGSEALLASRGQHRLWRVPLGADASLGACDGGSCAVALDPLLLDPFGVTLACRTDGKRRSAFIAYMASPPLDGYGAGTAWISELDLEDSTRPLRTQPLFNGPISDVVFDQTTDRLYAVGRYAGQVAPLFVIDLLACRPGDPGCTDPGFHALDLYQQQRGAELRSLDLSNPVPGQPRRAYVSAVLYDADLATASGVRPAYDVGGVVMVLDLVENVVGAPDYRLVRVLDAGLGAGQIRVLPARAGKRDLVVWTNSSAGTVTVYDDEVGAVARVLTYDPDTGAPLAGREPFGLAVADAGTSATVYLAAFGSSTVSVLDVPLDAPGQAKLRNGRIGKEFIP